MLLKTTALFRGYLRDLQTKLKGKDGSRRQVEVDGHVAYHSASTSCRLLGQNWSDIAQCLADKETRMHGGSSVQLLHAVSCSHVGPIDVHACARKANRKSTFTPIGARAQPLSAACPHASSCEDSQKVPTKPGTY